MVNRSFHQPVVVSGFPDLWAELLGCRGIPDTETLDLQPNGADLIVHALALHWADDPVGQLIQMRRGLRADGLGLACFFGGETLIELRQSIAQAESELYGGLSPRVLPMADIRQAGALLQRAGFALPVADVVDITLSYRDLWHLMTDLRAMGETNALADRRHVPARKSLFHRTNEIYRARFSTADGRIPARFQIFVLTGWAPDDSQQKPLRPGSAQQRLSDALGAQELRFPASEDGSPN